MKKSIITLSGKAKSGLGRGSYYMGQKEYKRQFVKKLGINPYHGTLNLSLSKANTKILMRIKKRKGILIKGFKRGKENFGDVLCYRAHLKGIKCALVLPKLSKHVAVAELISSQILRSTLKIKDGDKVKVFVEV